MSKRDVHRLYQALDAAQQEFEVAQMLGERACAEPMLDLAQKVINAIDSLPPEAQRRRMMGRKQTAEAVIIIYGPEPAPRLYSQEQQELDRERMLHQMGVL